MPVDVGADRQLVGQLDLDVVADVEVDPRAGHHPVVGPRLNDLARAYLPVDDRRGELEALRAVGQDLGFQWQIATAFGLRRKGEYRLHHLLVDGGPLLRRHHRVVFVARGPRSTRLGSTDHQRRRHARVGVAGDVAVQRVRASVEIAQVEGRRSTRLDVRREQVRALDPEVVRL